MVTGYEYQAYFGNSPLDWEELTLWIDPYTNNGGNNIISWEFFDVRNRYVVKRGQTVADVDPDPSILLSITDRDLNMATDAAGTYKFTPEEE